MSIELVQAKRTVLVAQRDQLMAQFNMTNGAVAACDELIAEILADQSRRKAADAELQKIAQDIAKERIDPPEVLEVIGVSAREVEPATAGDGYHYIREEIGMTPPKPPAMHSAAVDFEAAANVDDEPVNRHEAMREGDSMHADGAPVVV